MTSELFSGVFARGAAAEAVSDAAWLRAMLRVEAAIAQAAAEVVAVTPEAAAAVVAAAEPANFDLESVSAAARTGDPVAAVVARLKALVPREHHEAVQYGADAQDVIDTAMMLVAKDAMRRIKHDYRKCVTATALLQFDHDDLPAPGRTGLRRADPIQFGSLFGDWGALLANAREPAAQLKYRVSYTGPTGSGRDGDPIRARRQIARRLGELLELEYEWPWGHTDRTPVVRVAAAAAEMAGACGKVAVDALLLSQAEVGELVLRGEPDADGDGSFAPAAARACAARTPGLVATLFAAMPQELQRSPGLWQSEWETLSDLLRLTGSAASWLRETFQRLTIDSEAMRRNLEGGRG